MAKKAEKKTASGKKTEAKKTAAKKTVAKKAVAAKKRTRPLPEGVSAEVLDRLHGVILSRKSADPAVSHSARLLSRGTAKVAQKFGEEAVECLIEATLGNHGALVAESADVLYHLLVLWVDAGIAPAEIWAELHRREGVSGIAEKASRPHRAPASLSINTRKIP
jgi:phosphoribosyl-ATP pyrophosphohydrolase